MKTLKFISQTAMVAAATLMLSLVYTGCKKQDDVTPVSENKTTTPLTSDDAIGIGIDNNLLSSSFQDILKISDQADGNTVVSEPVGSTSFLLKNCGSVSLDNGIRTINYGTEACLGSDGNYRSGVITISGGTIAFQNYSLNFNAMNGTITTKFLGLNDAGNKIWSIVVDGSIIRSAIYDVNNQAATLTFRASWIKELVFRGDTTTIEDNIYAIHGTESGVTASGKSYTATVDVANPLMVYYNFPQYTCGMLNFEISAVAQPEQPATSTARVAEGDNFKVDYGFMDCQKDNLAKVLMDDGHSYVFALAKSAK